MKTIVWDVDDVLNDLMRVWFEDEWKPAHAGCHLSYEDIRENPPHRVLGIAQSDYLASLDRFRQSEKGRSLHPNRAVLDWLQCFGAEYRHVALTARPLDSIPELASWLFRHFGKYFRCFGFVPGRTELGQPVYDRDKGGFLNWMGEADLFIDDNPGNVAAARSLGIESVLYPQPWNGGSMESGEALKLIRERLRAN